MFTVADWFLLVVGYLFAVVGLLCLVLLIKRLIHLHRRPPPSTKTFYNRVITAIAVIVVLLSVGRSVEYLLVVYDVADADRITFDITLEAFFPAEVMLCLVTLLTYLWVIRIEDAIDESGGPPSFDESDGSFSSVQHHVEDIDSGRRALRNPFLRTSLIVVMANLVIFLAFLAFTLANGWDTSARRIARLGVWGATGAAHALNGIIFIIVVFRLHRFWVVDDDSPEEATVRKLTFAAGLFFGLLIVANGCLHLASVVGSNSYLLQQQHATLLASIGTAELLITLSIVGMIIGPSLKQEAMRSFSNSSFMSAHLLNETPRRPSQVSVYSSAGGGRYGGSQRSNSTLKATLPDGTRWAPLAIPSDAAFDDNAY